MSARYVCPNGHAVALVEMLPCNVKGCMAMIAYEPTAHGLALDRRIRSLEALVSGGVSLSEHLVGYVVGSRERARYMREIDEIRRLLNEAADE